MRFRVADQDLPFHGSGLPGGCIGPAGGLRTDKVFHVGRFVLAEVYGLECTEFCSNSKERLGLSRNGQPKQ
jgi:hypothetical protein